MAAKGDTSLLDTVAGTIERHHLLPTSREALVALSGGADSVALLRALVELGYRCTAAHCNFHLRGEESDRDEAFARRLCGSLGVELETAHFDTRQYAESHGVSVEMAARQLRYAFFDEVLRKRGIDSVAVAHHRSDNVETILLNTIRGTGIKGMLGMPYHRDRVVRPMLDADKSQIVGYLKAKGQDWVDDSTNQVADVKRNVVRLRLMPLLRDRNTLIVKPRTEASNAPQMTTRYAPASEYRSVPRCPEVACLDADKVGEDFSVRPTREGDRFVPLGMKGSKLVSDFMTDCKMDLFSKRAQTVMVSGSDIVWVVGRRIDDRYKVVEGQTRRLLICQLTDNNNQHLSTIEE